MGLRYVIECGPAVDLVRLAIALLFRRRREMPSGEVLSKVLFLTLYTDGEGRLVEPAYELPEDFTIYLKGPFIPIKRLLTGCGATDVVVPTEDRYFVRGNVDAVIREAEERLRSAGLGELVGRLHTVVDRYGGLGEEELINTALKVLGLNEVTKTMFFNVSLTAFIRIKKALREAFTKGVPEEEVAPEVWNE